MKNSTIGDDDVMKNFHLWDFKDILHNTHTNIIIKAKVCVCVSVFVRLCVCVCLILLHTVTTGTDLAEIWDGGVL